MISVGSFDRDALRCSCIECRSPKSHPAQTRCLPQTWLCPKHGGLVLILLNQQPNNPGSLDLILLITPPSQGISQAHHTHVQAIAASTFAGFGCCSPSPCSVPKQVFTYNSGQEEWPTCMAVPRQATHSLGRIHSCNLMH